ncbi:MAG: zf-HC2 domain-containing protein [Aggregatilineales bacterium]
MNELDFERLSAYLDGELSEDERAAIEARLAHEPALRETLSDLRTLKTWISALPELKAPRDFTLTASMLDQEPIMMRRALPYRHDHMTAMPQPKPRQRSNVIVTLAGLASSAAAIGLIVAGLMLAGSPAAPPAQIVLVSTETPTIRPTETKIIATALPQIQEMESEVIAELFSAAPAVEPAAAPLFPLPTSPISDSDVLGQISETLPEMPSRAELVPQAARELTPEPTMEVELESEVDAAEAMLEDSSAFADSVQPQLTQPALAVVLPTETPTTAPPTPTEAPSPAAEPAPSAAALEQRALGGLAFGAGAALLVITAALWLRWHRRARQR